LADQSSPNGPTAVQSLGAMWVYTALRFGLFFVLWGLLWVARVPGFLAAVIALVLSVPLSYVLLRKQRAQLAANLEQRIDARKARQHDLDDKLAGDDGLQE
jgi:UPF0716 family protein affecting phage T7 exclusion